MDEITEPEGITQGKSSSGLFSAFEWISAATVSLLAVTLIFTFLFRVVGVDGESMTNTLQDKDRLIIWSRLYVPDRDDIVVINRYSEEPLIKRVIAVAGDTLNIDADTGEVTLNGAVLDEPFIRETGTPAFGFNGPITVPVGYVFVMGDNRHNSLDSRMLGLFNTKDIMGEVAIRIWPFSVVGTP